MDLSKCGEVSWLHKRLRKSEKSQEIKPIKPPTQESKNEYRTIKSNILDLISDRRINSFTNKTSKDLMNQFQTSIEVFENSRQSEEDYQQFLTSHRDWRDSMRGYINQTEIREQVEILLNDVRINDFQGASNKMSQDGVKSWYNDLIKTFVKTKGDAKAYKLFND